MGATKNLVFQNVEKNDAKILLDGHNLLQLPNKLFTHSLSSTLTILDISNNKLRNLPYQIGFLTALQYLYACGNVIASITPNIKSLTSLKVFDLSRNCIKEISQEFCFLKQLTYLNLSGNDIQVVPKYLVSLPRLKKLFLLRNRSLSNVPKSIALKGLEAIRLYLNVTIEPCMSPPCYTYKKTESIIEDLVKVFSEQIKLVNNYRNKILSRQSPKTNEEIQPILYPQFEEPETLHRSNIQRNPQLNQCHDCGREKPLLRRLSSTSEYGSLSLTDFGSVRNQLQDDINISENDSCCTSECNNSFDCDYQNDSLTSVETEFESDEQFHRDFNQCEYVNAFQEMVLMNKGVKLTIPKFNLSAHENEDFTVDVIYDQSYEPALDSWSVLASQIIHLGPHGAKFYDSMQAIVKIPIGVAIEEGDIVECYTSDTDIEEDTNWQKLDVNELHVAGSYVQFEVTHFSLFAVIITKPRPKAFKRIEAEYGGNVILSDENLGCPIHVNFPAQTLNTDGIDASIELLYYDAFYVSEGLFESNMNALAGPVVSLGPNGCQFTNGVYVTIPLPHGKEVKELLGERSVIFMCSQTSVGFTPKWQQFQTEYTVNWNCNPCTVTFKVDHFTLFSVFWNILDETLPVHLKLHASSHVPHFSFWVYFQALMSETNESKKFGLCVMCYRFESQSIQGLAQYPLVVGECKLKKVKTGKLKIQLKSGMFEADESVGETSTELSKVVDFIGHDFDVHFACMFTSPAVPNTGLFGKVEISTDESLGREEFTFNLIKSTQSKRSNTSKHKIPSEWESKFTKELAGLLSIDDHMWKELALSLGYNRLEIQTKFSSSVEPIHEMLADFMGRGGEADEFMSAMYRVARMFKLIPLDEMRENQQNRRLEQQQQQQQQHRDTPGSSSNFCVCPNASTSSSNARKRKIDALFSSREPLSESKFDDIAGEISKMWKSIGRKLDVTEPELREIELNYQHAGEKEKAFQMLIAWRERDPENCVSGTLYTILQESGMKYTATKCMQ